MDSISLLSRIESSLLNACRKTGTFCVFVALKLVISQSPFSNISVLSINASSIANVSDISCLSYGLGIVLTK